jgi:predicted metal-dependent hydrolase
VVTEIVLGGISVEIVQKDIKNVHLSVNPPDGKVRVSAPTDMNIDVIRSFALSKLSWIKKQQTKITSQERETPREYLDRESHYVWGKRYLLSIVECNKAPHVELSHDKMLVMVRPGTPKEKIQTTIEQWYRDILKDAVPEIIEKWEPILGVKVEHLFVQKMKTKWGGCMPEVGNIRINTELARKPREFLEYVVIHEMVHLIEPTHNSRFTSLMDLYLPNWKQYRDELNRLPLPEETWA